MLHFDHRSDDIIVYALATLSVLLHFGNKLSQEQISAMARHNHMEIFGRMHKILTTASSVLLEERYSLARIGRHSPIIEEYFFLFVWLNELMRFPLCMQTRFNSVKAIWRRKGATTLVSIG